MKEQSGTERDRAKMASECLAKLDSDPVLVAQMVDCAALQNQNVVQNVELLYDEVVELINEETNSHYL